MIRIVRYSFFLVLCALLAGVSWAQGPAIGTPPFGSFSGGPDVINNANLNAHITIPVLHKPGRGMDFTYDLEYDSSIWYPVGVSGNQSWQHVANMGWTNQAPARSVTGSISYSLTNYSVQSGYCGSYLNTYWYIYVWTYGNWTYTDTFGVTHNFSGTATDTQQITCTATLPEVYTTFTSVAQDGSGYGLTAGASCAVWTPCYATTPSGTRLAPPLSSSNGLKTDRNGNQILVNGSGQFFDTLSGTTPVLLVSGAGTPTVPITFQYTAPSAPASYRMNFTNYTVATNFGASTIKEYKSAAAVPLVSSITLPDGSQYSFSYESTPSTPVSGACTPYAGTTCVTGRVTSVILPTGGTISYSYSGGNNGILSDGSAAILTRGTPDGSWIYSQVKNTGAASTTTLTDPQNNQTVMQFQGIYETQRQTYQGSTGGTLLQTTNTCYNAATAPCTGTAIVLPIAQRTVLTQLGSNGLQQENVYAYNSYGLPTEKDVFDYASGTPTTTLSKIIVVYASLGNGIFSMPASVMVQDGGGNTKAYSTYTYDVGTPVVTSGTPQHVSVSGSRGNVTSVNYYTSGSSYLTTNFTYFDTGNVKTAKDINAASKTYNYADLNSSCGFAFPTSVTEPLSMSQNLTWNCTGGVQTSLKDENGQTSGLTTSITYSDNYFWRAASVTDPTGATTSYSYPTSAPYNWVSSNTTVVSGQAIVNKLTTFDGLGRTSLAQTEQGPNSVNYDTVETDYDGLGRVRRVTLPFNATAGGTSSTAPGLSTQYDALGRVSAINDSGSGSESYSYLQNDVKVIVGPPPTNENAKQHQFEYDALGHLTSVCEITSASGSGACGQNSVATGYWTKYTYDALGDLTSVTQNAQPGGTAQTRSYSYDQLGRLTHEATPESSTINYTFDTDSTCAGSYPGDLVKRVDAQGNTRCATYDVLHRPLQYTYSGPYAGVTPNRYFVYDTATLNLVTMTNGKKHLAEAYTSTTQNGTKITDLGFSYSPRGEVTDVYESTPHSSGYYHVNQTYWPHGLPYQLSQLVGLPTISYGGTIGSTVGLDGEGRITQVTASAGQNPVTGVTYSLYANPPKLSVTFGSGDSDVQTYDATTGRTIAYQFNINTQSASGTLTWNANSSLQKLVISDPFNSADTQTCNYGYDDLVRLTSANCGTAANQTFSYDQFGNITKSGSPYSFFPTYSASTNHMTAIGTFTPTYDSNGNVTNDGNHVYTWDADANSITIDSVGLTYDALDRAVEKSNAGVYTEIVYAPTGGKLALMAAQILQIGFISLPGKATAVYAGGGLDHYRHADWLGSARLTSSTSRTVLSTTAYAPFGEAYAQSGTPDVSFTGANSDTVNADYDFLYREYSTEGRWPSPDPAGFAAVNTKNPQSWNRYAYVLNNPMALTDPTGLDCIYHEDGSSQITVITGDCIDGQGGYDNGVFVDGTIDTNAPITLDPTTGDLTFGLTSDNGAFGTGIALGLFDPLTPDPNQGSLYGSMMDPKQCPTCRPILNGAGQAINIGVGVVAVEATVVLAVATAPVTVPALKSAYVAGTVGVEAGPGWENVYDFGKGVLNPSNPPISPGGVAGQIVGQILHELFK